MQNCLSYSPDKLSRLIIQVKSLAHTEDFGRPRRPSKARLSKICQLQGYTRCLLRDDFVKIENS